MSGIASTSSDRFNPDNFMTEAEIEEWVRTTRHKVMYRDESRIDKVR
jgi:5,6-dimethylbenzimidazole synthase